MHPNQGRFWRQIPKSVLLIHVYSIVAESISQLTALWGLFGMKIEKALSCLCLMILTWVWLYDVLVLLAKFRVKDLVDLVVVFWGFGAQRPKLIIIVFLDWFLTSIMLNLLIYVCWMTPVEGNSTFSVDISQSYPDWPRPYFALGLLDPDPTCTFAFWHNTNATTLLLLAINWCQKHWPILYFIAAIGNVQKKLYSRDTQALFWH